MHPPEDVLRSLAVPDAGQATDVIMTTEVDGRAEDDAPDAPCQVLRSPAFEPAGRSPVPAAAYVPEGAR